MQGGQETPARRATPAGAIDWDGTLAMHARSESWSRYAGPELIGWRAPRETLVKGVMDPVTALTSGGWVMLVPAATYERILICTSDSRS